MARVCEDWFPLGSYPKQRLPGIHMDDGIKAQIDVMIKNITNDWDFTIIITGGGEVRVGKSALALQIGTYWTYMMEKVHNIKVPFNAKQNIIFQWEKLIESGNELGSQHRYCCLIYDEAGETMEGTKSATQELRAVRDYLRECGQYNFLNILVLPEFFDLPKGIALTRSICLIDVNYNADKDGIFQRGYFNFYSRPRKKNLYLKGKKFLDYKAGQYSFSGTFNNGYGIIEDTNYRTTKREALRTREANSKDKVKLLAQTLTYILYSMGFSPDRILVEINKLNKGVTMISQRALYNYIEAFRVEKPAYTAPCSRS